MTLLDHLIKKFPASSRQTLKRMVEQGRVTINGSAATKLKQPVPEDQVIQVRDRAPATPPAKFKLPFAIVFEDQDLLVIDKPAGLLTSTVPGEKRATALAMVERYLAANDPRARAGLIHRLDRDAAGLLVFSKNDPAYQSLKSQFFHHTVRRMYTAIVSHLPDPPRGRIESRLVEWADGKVRIAKMKGKGQPAITEYALARHTQSMAELRVTLQTGRKHQIRAHLSDRGWPIIGDTLYGGPVHSAGLMLAATELDLDHPRTGQRKKFQIKPPAALIELLERMK